MKREKIQTLRPAWILEDAYNKYSPLKVVFGLATGEQQRDGDKIFKDEHPDLQRKCLVIAVAHANFSAQTLCIFVLPLLKNQ